MTKFQTLNFMSLDSFHALLDEKDDEISRLRTIIQNHEADLAVMRSALQLAKEVTSNGFLPNPHTKRFDMTHFDVHATIDKALSTSAGKAYQERMEEAVRLLGEVKWHDRAYVFDHVNNDESGWAQRRDTLLEQLKGGKP